MIKWWIDVLRSIEKSFSSFVPSMFQSNSFHWIESSSSALLCRCVDCRLSNHCIGIGKKRNSWREKVGVVCLVQWIKLRTSDWEWNMLATSGNLLQIWNTNDYSLINEFGHDHHPSNDQIKSLDWKKDNCMWTHFSHSKFSFMTKSLFR